MSWFRFLENSGEKIHNWAINHFQNMEKKMRNDSWCFNLRYFAEIENLLICKLKLKNLSRHRYWLAQTWIGRWKRSTNYKTRFMVRKVQKLSLEMTHGIYTVAHLRCHQVKVSCLLMFCVVFWNLSSFCDDSAHWLLPSLRCWIHSLEFMELVLHSSKASKNLVLT